MKTKQNGLPLSRSLYYAEGRRTDNEYVHKQIDNLGADRPYEEDKVIS